MNNFQIIFLFTLLISAAVIDFRIQKIPNMIVYPSMLIALISNWFLNGMGGLLFSAGGIAIGTALLIIPYLMGGMGAGDAKLMGAIGGFLGAKGVLYAFVLTAVAGGIYALIMIVVCRAKFQGFSRRLLNTFISFLLTRQYVPDTQEIVDNRPKLCYGLPIAIGTGVFIVLETIGYKFIS